MKTKKKTKPIINEFCDAVASAIGHAVSIQDPDFRIIYQNHLHKNLKGDQTGEFCYKVYDRRDKVCERCPVALSFADGQVHTLEKNGTTKDMRKIHVEITASPLKDPSGKIIACVELVKDITTRKSLEESARKSRARKHALLSAIPDMMFLTDRDGVFIDFKAETDTLYASPEKFLGKKITEVLPSHIAGPIMTYIAHMLETGQLQIFEYSLPVNGRQCEWEARIVATGEGEVLTIVRDITKRKQAERALKESEDKYRSVFEATGTATSIVDEDMTFLLVNAEFEKLSGYSKKEIEGKIKWTEVVAKEYHERMIGYHHLRRIDPSAAPKTYEFKFIDKNGVIKDVIITTEVIPGTKKSVASLLDITERKKVEDELFLAEAKFHSLVEQSLVGFYILQDGLFPYANPKCAEIFGYTADEFISSKLVTDLIIEEDHGIAMEDIRKLLQKESLTVIDTYRGRRKDGTIIQFEAQGTLTEYDGDPAIIGTVVDITERKRAEKALLEHSLQQKAILSNIPDMAWLKDRESRYIAVNEPFGKACGTAPEDLCGKTDFDLWPVELAEKYRTDDREVMETGRRKQVEETLVEKDGEKIWLETIKPPIFNDNGKVIGTTGIARDITKRKLAQQEEMRSGRLASLGELAAGVAHEINNPVNGIISYAELLLEETKKGSEAENITNQIIAEGERIAYIVRSLLSFARDRKEEKHPVYLQGMLLESFALIGARIQKDGITLKMDIPPDLPMVIAHSQQIGQVFLNIISNARYALNRRYPGSDKNKVLAISAEQITLDGRPYVKLVFYDQGTGIPSGALDKVINPFFTTKPGGSGTGLGLSISHGIITDHAGRLSIDSEEGKFTRVTISLPAAEHENA